MHNHGEDRPLPELVFVPHKKGDAVTRREQIVILNQKIGLLEKRVKLLEEERGKLSDQRSDLVIEGFKNGEKLLDLIAGK